MKRLSEIEVEPLSDERWSKIERSLVSRLALEANRPAGGLPVSRPRTRARVWFLVAALVGAFGGAFFALRSPTDRAVVEQPSRITTGVTGSHLALPGLSLDVEPHSAVVVSGETPQGMLIVVDRGSITCRVAPRASDAPLVVQAGEARVRVVGTRFSVTRLGESARVEVREGVVEVSARGRSFRVRAGEKWPTEAPRIAPADAAAIPSVALPEPAGDATHAPTERPLPGTRAPAPPRLAEPQASSRTSSESPQAVFERATALERSDPGRASELYATLESGGDSWAQNALYARGRLEASRGNRAEARRLLERYLERFPRGSNAEDARAVLERLR